MRKTALLLAPMTLAVLLACVVALGVVETPAQAAFPGANGRIAAVSNLFVADIYTMNSDGTDVTYLPDIENSEDERHPAWSADGQKIAFAGGVSGSHEIYIIDFNTEQLTRLTNNTDDDRFPTWSPDNQKIAFVSNRDGDNDIYVMDANPATDDATNISKTSIDESTPDWSPGGQKIAFAVCCTRPGISVMNKDGSNKKRITSGTLTFGDPAWSPNGRKIAFERFTPEGEFGDYEIFVMNRDGSNKKRITYNETDDYAPDWQPIVP